MAVGAYRRAILIAADEGQASARMEDDFHCFAVRLRHDGATIESVSVDSIRVPWVTCPAASIALERLAGRAIAAPMPFGDRTERFANCTHMLDLANLALAHVHEPGFRRHYRIEVDFPEQDRSAAWLDRDGARLFDWRVEGKTIAGGRFDGRTPDDLIRDPKIAADPALLEAVTVLRRALRIAGGRFVDLDKMRGAEDLGPIPATCHTLLPANRPHAVRNRGTARDFSGEGRWPLTR